jgi:two-component system, LytTR family, response regulator
MSGELPVPELIFVTAYSDYMERAFELHAIDYLRKPYTDTRFANMLEHARRRVGERRAAASRYHGAAAAGGGVSDAALAAYRGVLEAVRPERLDGRIAIFDRTNASFALVHAHEIDWVEVDGTSQVCVHRNGARFTWRKSISSLEHELAPLGFIRVHRSYLVNAARIERIKELQKGEYSLELRDGTLLDTGRTYRPVIEAFLSRMPGGR